MVLERLFRKIGAGLINNFFNKSTKEIITSKLELDEKIPIINYDGIFDESVANFNLTVPEDYVYEDYLNNFIKKYFNPFPSVLHNKYFITEDFSRCSQSLIPGKTYKGSVIPVIKKTNEITCLSFLMQNNCLLVGFPGLMLVRNIFPEKFPVASKIHRGYVFSFDKESFLFTDESGQRRVPFFERGSGTWKYRLGYLKDEILPNSYLLCFQEI